VTKDKEVLFNDSNILLKGSLNKYVMMDWETDLMKHHALRVTQNKGDILEIGFGMGISANFIQQFGCKTHTIVEVNPQILQRLYRWAEDKPNVIIIEGDWYESLDNIGIRKYDGIWYDADCKYIMKVKSLLVDSFLKPGGIFTYFDPSGMDRYKYSNQLKLDLVEIFCDIPTNIYHNDKICYCPYVCK
jgi:guanidinoacetate N-methyltransferase